ncbi:hypothetical protein AB0M58_41945 [Streptomyces bobili]|uniref:hypothetical protein n=1 Tax=Streptomyces bobili TaxID=67280 RepID=UPI00341407EF
MIFGVAGVHICRFELRSTVCWWDSRPAIAWTVSLMLAAAKAAGQGPPVLQVGDAMLDTDTS